MTTVLGRDLGADALGQFGGRLYTATLHKDVATVPSGSPTSTNISTTDYTCDAIAFRYEESYVDGERIKRGDYRVVILLRSLPGGIVPNPGDRITIPPPGQTAPTNARIMTVDALTEAQITVHVRGPGV